MAMTSASVSRSADATIKGFIYQFDHTIINLLKSDPLVRVTIEGVEDLDLQDEHTTTSVQCKHLEAAKFGYSVIREPIAAMLRSFHGGRRYKYRLYAHFGDSSGLTPTLAVPQLKECLTFTTRPRTGEPRENRLHEGIPDDTLSEFLSAFKIIEGPSFEDQRAEVHSLLQKALKCTPEDCRDLHYGNALATVCDLAIHRALEDRQITSGEFLRQVNVRPALYARWHKETVSLKAYVNALQRQARSLQIHDPVRMRLAIIQISDTANINDYLDLIRDLATRVYGAGRLTSAKPWTVVIEASAETIRKIKVGILRLGVAFNDGREDLEFNVAMFERPPLINVVKRSPRISDASYYLRLISADTYKRNIGFVAPPDRVALLSTSTLSEYAWPESPTRIHISDADMQVIRAVLGV